MNRFTELFEASETNDLPSIINTFAEHHGVEVFSVHVFEAVKAIVIFEKNQFSGVKQLIDVDVSCDENNVYKASALFNDVTYSAESRKKGFALSSLMKKLDKETKSRDQSESHKNPVFKIRKVNWNHVVESD